MNNQPPPDDRAELEARVTALLLGELSAEDAAAMRQILARDAGLAKLHERLRLTLDLVRESAATPAGELTGQPVPLKLSPARREALLAHFKTLAPREFARPKARRMSLIVELAAAAAILLVAAGLLLPSLSRAKNKASVMAHIDVASVAAPRQSAAASKANLALKPAPPPASPIYLGAPSGESSGEQLADQGLKPNARGVSVDQALSALSESEGLTINRQADTAHAGTVDLTSDKELTYNGTNGPGASPEGGAYSLNSVGYVNVAAATSSFSTINASDFRFYTYAADSTDISDRLGDLFPEPSGMSASKTSTLQNPLQQRANSAATLAMSTASSTLSGNTGGGGFGGVAMGGGGGGGGGFGGGGGGVAGFPVGRDSVEPKLGDIGGNVFGFQLASNTDGITLDVVTLNDVGGQEYLYRTNGPAFEFSTPASEASQRQTLQREAAEKAKADAEAKLKLSLRSLADESAKAGVKKEIHPVLRSFSEGGNPPSFAKPTEGGQSAIPLVPPAEIQTRDNAFSTFSLNVSDVSFKLAAASLQNGPPARRRRRCAARSSSTPSIIAIPNPRPARRSVCLGTRGLSLRPQPRPAPLLRQDRRAGTAGGPAAEPGFAAGQIRLDGTGGPGGDHPRGAAGAGHAIAGAGHAERGGLLRARRGCGRTAVPGSQAGGWLDELEGLTPEGGTNLEEAMRLAYEAALRHYLANGENRVVILTDGAANLGNVEPDALKKSGGPTAPRASRWIVSESAGRITTTTCWSAFAQRRRPLRISSTRRRRPPRGSPDNWPARSVSRLRT
jgi:anti-sigma factor RsiW